VGTNTGVSKSTNGGESWFAVNRGLRRKGGAGYLAIDPRSPQTVYASTAKGVFKTINGGRSWRSANTGFKRGYFVGALAIDPQSPQIVYVVTIRPEAR
jgi:hypothetical protein